MALVAPSLVWNGKSFILTGTGGGNNSFKEDSGYDWSWQKTYGYEISEKKADGSLVLITRFRLEPTAGFTKDLKGILTKACDIVVREYEFHEEWVGEWDVTYSSSYSYSAESNIISIESVTPYTPKVSYDHQTNEMVITNESPIDGIEVYKANGSMWEPLQSIDTALSVYRLSLDGLLTQTSDLMVRATYYGKLSNDSEPVTVQVIEGEEIVYSKFDLFKYYSSQIDRLMKVRATIGGVLYSDSEIVEFDIEGGLIPGDEFVLGATVSAKLTLSLRTEDTIPTNAKIVPEIMLDGELGPSDWVPLGAFYIDERFYQNNVWKFSCFDKIMLTSKPYYPTFTSWPVTMQAVMNEICLQAGLTLDSSVVINPAYQIDQLPANATMREIIGYIASAHASSVMMTRDEKLAFVKFPPTAEVTLIGPAEYIRAEQTNPLKTYTRILLTYNQEGNAIEAGVGDDDHTLNIYNPYIYIEGINQNILADVLAAINGFSYTPMTMDWKGRPELDIGAPLEITQRDGSKFSTIILTNKLSFKGGLIVKSTAPSKSQQRSEFDLKSPIKQYVDSKIGVVSQRLTESETAIEQNAYEIGLKASVEVTNELGERLQAAESSLTVQAGEIALKATKIEVDAVEDRLTTAEASISVQATEISSKVSKGSVISEINQSAEAVKIQASKISLVGAVTVLSDISGNLGTITAGSISLSTDIRVGNRILIGSQDSTSVNKEIRFNNWGGLFSSGMNVDLAAPYVLVEGSTSLVLEGYLSTITINSSGFSFSGGNVNMNSYNIAGIYRTTTYKLQVDENAWVFGTLGCSGNLTVHGSKNAVVTTESYGERLLYCYEGAEAKFMDDGTAVLVNGECIIQLDPIWLETVDILSDDDYIIDVLTPIGSCLKLAVKEKHFDHFVIMAEDPTANIQFDWGIRATRKGYKGVRLFQHLQEGA